MQKIKLEILCGCFFWHYLQKLVHSYNRLTAGVFCCCCCFARHSATKLFFLSSTGRLLWYLSNLKAEYNILMIAYQKIFYFVVLVSFTYDIHRYHVSAIHHHVTYTSL